MKKIILVLLVGLVTSTAAFSQGIPKFIFGNSFEFHFSENGVKAHRLTSNIFMLMVQDTAIYRATAFEKPGTKQQHRKPTSPIMLGVKLNPKLSGFFVPSVPSVFNNYPVYTISDSSAAIVVALGITKENIKDYRYRVIENNNYSAPVLWLAIPGLEQKYGARQAYGFIGRFKAPGKQLTVEVINIKNQKIKDGIVFNWHGNSRSVNTSKNESKHYFGNNIEFHFIKTDTRMHSRGPTTFSAQDDAIYRAINFEKSGFPFEDIMPVSPIMLGVKLNPKLSDYFAAEVTSVSKTYSSYIISDRSDAILVALGITKDNIKNFKYRVIENDSAELVPWSKIPRLEQKYGATQPYGFIGKFNAPGKQLLVEVQNINDYGIRDGVVFDWRVNYKPVITEILVNLPDNGTNRIGYFNLNFKKMNRGYATRFDSKTDMPLDFKFPVDSIDNLRLSFKSHETVAYSVYLIKNIAGKIDTTTLNRYLLNNFLGNFYDIDSKYFNKPGKYQVIIQRNAALGYWGEDQILRLPFEVHPPPVLEKKASLKQALPYLAGILAGIALLFLGYRRSTNIKLARSAQARQTTSLRLRSIRAQLNPHFMFNALTSIQNLMNKKDAEGANHYLSRFAELTRKVLNTSEQELISLEDEVKILDDYLQMEQLRFNFQYELIIDDKINIANTEVPAMLLQPFVENAVKHGVANMREKGVIRVFINQNDNNLVFSISDNGPGFQHKNNGEGAFGLKLSEERIKLLNEVYTGQPATLDIDTNASGTTVTIILINWIS